MRRQVQNAGQVLPSARRPVGAVADVIAFPGRDAPPMSCLDCLALFGDGSAAAVHARRRSHLVAIDYRPAERWRAELIARNLSIAAAAAAMASHEPSTDGAPC